MVHNKMALAVELTDAELELVAGGQPPFGFGGGQGHSRGGAFAVNGPLGTGAAGAWRSSSATGFGVGAGPGGGVGVGWASGTANAWAYSGPLGSAAGSNGTYNAGGMGVGLP